MTQADTPRPRAMARRHRPPRPAGSELLIVGNATRDEVHPGREHALGGTAAFAARAASCMGVRSHVVTAVPPQFALLDPLVRDPYVYLHRVNSRHETAFRLRYTPRGRRLDLLSLATPLHADDVPKSMRHAACTYVAPIMGECDAALVESLKSDCIVACAQGWLRDCDARGRIVPALGAAMSAPPRNLTAMVFSELDHPEADALAQHLAQRRIIVALTRGRRGVSLFMPKRIDLRAAPATEVDPTGAGDVFGLVFALCLSRGANPVAAAGEAVEAAACVVEGPGLGRLDHWVAERAAGCGAAPSVGGQHLRNSILQRHAVGGFDQVNVGP